MDFKVLHCIMSNLSISKKKYHLNVKSLNKIINAFKMYTNPLEIKQSKGKNESSDFSENLEWNQIEESNQIKFKHLVNF